MHSGIFETLTVAAEFAACAQSLFLCLLLLCRPAGRTPADLALAGAALVFALSMADDFMTVSGAYAGLPLGVLYLGNSLPSLLGPLVYLHARALIEGPDWRPEPGNWRHGLWFAGLLACDLPLFLLPPTSLAWQLFSIPASLGAVLVTAIQAPLYLLKSIRLARRAEAESLRLSWLRFLLQLLALAWAIYVVDDGLQLFIGRLPGLDAVFAMSYAAILYGLAWVGRHRDSAFIRPAPFAKYSKSAQTDDAAAKLVAKIEAAMRRDALYRDSALSLPALARHAGARPHAVSQALNQHAGLSYFDYVNRFRIEEAKTLLADPAREEESVLEIAFAVGFNSKSTFNAAFKKFAGLTPSEFRSSRSDRTS